MKRSKWFKSTAVIIALTTGVPSFAKPGVVSQSESFRSQVLLEQRSFQNWSSFLINGRSQGAALGDLNGISLQSIVPLIQSSGDILAKTFKALESVRLSQAEDYMNLASDLLKMRQLTRQSQNITVAEKRKSLFLLQMMAEEALYVGSRKFQNFPAELSLVGDSRTTLKDSMLKEFSVQTGDILLAKSSGSGSSSLIALSMDEPHIFSHSTPVYINDHGQALSPEAFIEDGVKLRNLQDEYASDKKTRLYIYRLKSDVGTHRAVEETMSSFVDEMQKRTGNKADSQAAYSYDFTMTPGDIETRGLFCSSVSLEVYNSAGVRSGRNPYPSSLWSSISGPRSKLLQILGIKNNAVPAPGDLEANTNFELVGARINIKKLAQERVELALFDILIDEALSEKKILSAIASKLEALNEKPLQKEKLLELIEKGLIPKTMLPQVKVLDQIPNDIKLSQLVLFGFLNEVLTPQVRQLMLSEVQKIESSGRIVTAVELRQLLRQQAGQMRLRIQQLLVRMDQIEKEG